MNAYIMIHDGPDRDKITVFLDTLPEVVNWRSTVAAIFLISTKDEDWLTDKIHGEFPDLLFMVSLFDLKNINGWFDKETWSFLQEPKPA